MEEKRLQHIERVLCEQLEKSLAKRLKEESPYTEVKFIVTCDDNGCLDIFVNGKHGHTRIKTVISSVKIMELMEEKELINNLLWWLLTETQNTKGSREVLTMKTIRDQSKTTSSDVLSQVEINRLIYFVDENSEDDDEEEADGQEVLNENIKEACDEVAKEVELKKFEKILDEYLKEFDYISAYTVDESDENYLITLEYENGDLFVLEAECYEIFKARSKDMINRSIKLTKHLMDCKKMFDKLMEGTPFHMSYRINYEEQKVVLMVLNINGVNIFSKPYDIRGKDQKVVRTQLFEDFMSSFIPWTVGTDRISGLINLIYNAKHNYAKDRRTPEVITIESNSNEITMTMSMNVDNKHVAITATIKNPDISKETLNAFKDIRFDDEHYRHLINAKNFCLNYLETKF